MTVAHHHHGAPAALAPAQKTPAWKLLVTLAIAGAAAGLLVVSVYRLTLPAIQKYAAVKADAAVREVLKSPARWDTLYLVKGALVTSVAEEAQRRELPKAFVGFDQDGKRVGVAITAEGPGFQEILSMMIGFDPATGALLGIRVLDEKETPGLGDKIETDKSFLAQFTGRVAPVVGTRVKPGDGTSQVQTITGATISSRAVIRIVNAAVARWRPLVNELEHGGAR
ncbi:MAG: RnfABCDGE type electron transport complex subunit G [Gemmatimonadales bacterium]